MSSARNWGPVAWTVWAVSVVGGILASLLVSFLVRWKEGGGCSGRATSAHARDGLTALAIAALVIAAPWVLAAFVSKRRGRMLVGLLLAIVPLAVMAATHLHRADWNGGGFCF
jgi:hypothetical protein